VFAATQETIASPAADFVISGVTEKSHAEFNRIDLQSNDVWRIARTDGRRRH
jgi:hypothetical protein